MATCDWGCAWIVESVIYCGAKKSEILGINPERHIVRPEGRKEMVIQLVGVSIRPEQRDKWLELIRMNAAQTCAEEGCESYQISEDLETPNRFVIVEQWASLEAQYNHFRKPEFGELMGALGDVIAGPPEVSIHDVASTLTLDEALAAAGVSP